MKIFNAKVLKPMELEDWVEKHSLHQVSIEGGRGFTFLHCHNCRETYLYSMPAHLFKVPKSKKVPKRNKSAGRKRTKARPVLPAKKDWRKGKY